jgi:hypothetical protein
LSSHHAGLLPCDLLGLCRPPPAALRLGCHERVEIALDVVTPENGLLADADDGDDAGGDPAVNDALADRDLPWEISSSLK